MKNMYVRDMADDAWKSLNATNISWGDGGGGVDNEMLEYTKRYKSFPGLPETQISKIEDSLENMRQKAVAAGDKVVVWKDELYLEEHRGVHTTKALLKKLNRC